MDRIEQLKAFAETKPSDPFPRYALALEYRKQGQPEAAQTVFDELLTSYSEYLATYLMCGQNLIALNRRSDAAGVLQRGIALASKQGNMHAKAELEGALAEIDGA